MRERDELLAALRSADAWAGYPNDEATRLVNAFAHALAERQRDHAEAEFGNSPALAAAKLLTDLIDPAVENVN